MALAVEMKNITKTFYGMKANDDISFQVEKGEIHALLGENGAGKSTLMNILFGLYQADQGEILIHETPAKISDPQMAIDLGIGMVHQHFMLVDNFTVLENIILGAEPRKRMSIDYNKASKEIETLSNQYGLKINLNSQVRDISIGMQQKVEILKTLYRGADILIFDEPTAVLTPQEIQELTSIMKNLTSEGKTVILITHKLKEILTIANAVTVIRRGKVCDTLRVKDTNEVELAEKMVGRKVTLQLNKDEKEREGLVLSLRDVRAKDNRGLDALHGIDLEVYGGEIVGIAGVDGNGQSELVEVITGLRQAQSGEMILAGNNISGLHTRQIHEKGIAHIPEDRHRLGIVMDMTLSENLVLNSYFKKEFNKRGLLNEKSIKAHARKLIDKFDIRTPSESAKIRALSGGNQQKAVIAREIEGDPKLLIAAQPTRGLDVGAIEFIHRQILNERDEGKAVLLVSFELEEILSLSDRIAVIYEGRIVGIVDPKETTEQELGLLMSGRSARKETVE